MKRGHSTKAMTKEEAAWVGAVKRAGCLLCEERGYGPTDGEEPAIAEAHHLLSGGIRIGHMATVGLCAWHHRGRLIVNGWNHQTHRQRLGPALSEGSKPFHEAWGTDEEIYSRARAHVARRNRT